MRPEIIKQALFSAFCAGFGWYLAAWWASILHRPFAFSSFGFLTLVLPALALVYIRIQKAAGRKLYLGLLVLHYVLLAGWLISLGDDFQTAPGDHYFVVVIFVGYIISQIGAWIGFYSSKSKPE